MESPFFNRLGRILWIGLVVLVVTLAVYVSVGRLITANLAGYRSEILQVLNARLPFVIEAQQVSADWQSFTPAIVLTDLRLRIPGSTSPPLALSQGRISVDVPNSLRTRSLQLTRLVLNGLSLRGELSDDGVFRLAGFSDEPGQAAESLEEFLLNIERISLRDNRLLLALPNGESRDLGLDLELSREGSQRHVQATLLSSTGARISVLAQGLGNPFRPELFSGQIYLGMQSTDLGAVKDLFAEQAPVLWVDGAVDLGLWLNWDKGTSSIDARMEGHNVLLTLRDASWHIPLERVALGARLVRRDKRWSLFVSDLQLENDGVAWNLPRLQLDAWGNTLRVRAADVLLQPLNAIVTRQEAVPEALREVFAALDLRGELPAVQLRIADMTQAAQRWEIEANFASVAVASLHGAPGATAARGYTKMGPGGGVVVLDSQSISLDFPTIYHQPLHFKDLYGSLHLAWDAATVRLDSGLLTTQGDEGRARVLFGLDIPLQPNTVGIEMDLLVGLEESHPTHRDKFIPYILAPSLLDWLADSIGEGRIEQGAFLWRGSLGENAAPLRTVQLAFNVADTRLSYHSQWPPVLVEQGTVLIDDSNVSVWAEQASLFASRVDQLSVEARLNTADELTLDLQGSIHGPASDGFKVLNDSPLAGIVGPTFSDWLAAGRLDTELRLHINLSDDSTPPRVEVATRWENVDLSVMPGNLPLQAINGDFAYSTETGFSASSLTGTLWGKAISAGLRQQHETEEAHYSPATTVVDIELASRVDLADLRRWLQLEALPFARGETAADLVIRLKPGEPPLLTVRSDLQGVTLDLPQPWNKSADETQPLTLEIPLVAGVMPLSLDLGEQLHLQLEVAAGAVRAAALGINEAAPPIESGVLRVTGHTQLLQVDEWLNWYGGLVGKSGPDDSPPVPFLIAIDNLRADSVVFLDQVMANTVLSLALNPAQWSLSLQSDWLRGELSLARSGGASHLAIEYLDLDRLPDFTLAGTGSESPWDIPTLDVSLRNLFQTEQRLGELAFVLHGKGSVVHADNITGELAKLQLRAERPGRLVWHRGEAAYTELQAALQFADLGQALEYFDYQRIVETDSGEFSLALQWPGAPQDFSLSTGQGSAQVTIGHGSFLEAPAGASGALRVVSILNLADIVRSLSLSNMFESGIPFDSVQGEIDLRDGMLELTRMDVKGGSRFQFSGVSDVRTRSLDGELVATLPVANNLPWIAALAASLPVAAGVYLVSQVFSKQMDRLSSAVYTISGSWNDPEVNFDRIFDDTPDSAPAAGAAPDQPASP